MFNFNLSTMKKENKKENEFVSFRSPVNRMIKWWKSKESDDVKSSSFNIKLYEQFLKAIA
jgi:hypothetical protein